MEKYDLYLGENNNIVAPTVVFSPCGMCLFLERQKGMMVSGQHLYMCMQAPVRARVRTHARARARAHTHTHTHIFLPILWSRGPAFCITVVSSRSWWPCGLRRRSAAAQLLG
jgi:hypothetical protein